MKKLLLFLISFTALFTSDCYSAFTTDWLRNTSSSITVNGSTYTWNAGTGGSGQFLQNVNGVITSAVPSGGGGGSSTLAVGTGTASNFTTLVSSPTGAISFLGSQFQSTVSGTTNFISIDPSILGGGGATVNVTPWSVLYSTDGTSVSGDAGFQYDNSVSSVTLSGEIGPTSLYINNPSNSSGSSFYFNGNNSNPLYEMDTRNSFVSDYGGSFKFQGTQFGRFTWSPAITGGYGIYLSSVNILTPLLRHSISRDTGKHVFYGANSDPLVQFDPVGNSSFTIPVVLTTLPSASSLATDSTGKIIAGSGGSSDSSNGTLFAMMVSSNVSNSTAETNVIATGSGTITIPANFMQPGKTIRVRASGTYISTTTATTLTVKFKIGNTVIASSANITMPSTQSNYQMWAFGIAPTIRSGGASGTLYSSGLFGFYTDASGWTTAPMVSTGPVTIDMTTAQEIKFTAQWSVANSSNNFINNNFVVVTETVTIVGASNASNIGAVGVTYDPTSAVVGSTIVINVPYAATVSSWTVTSAVSGSVSLSVIKSASGPVSFNAFSGGGNAPSLTSSTWNSAAPSGWSSTSITANDTIGFVLNSISGTTPINVSLKVTKQ